MGLLVLGGPLQGGHHGAGGRLVSRHLRGPSKPGTGGPALLGRGSGCAQAPHWGHGGGGRVGPLSRGAEVGRGLAGGLGQALGVHRLVWRSWGVADLGPGRRA